ncbi:MAG: hypothetical protein V3T64_03935, partial [Myxococcota bacterium]
PKGKLMVVPKAEIVVEDSWHTSGLRGTGSTHFHAEDLFVPEHRTIGFPFPEPQRGGALIRLPVLGFFGPAFSGFPQGVGRRALDEIVTLAKSKSRIGRETTVAERPVFQRDLALAYGQLHSVGLWVRQELQQLWTDLHDAVDASELTTARRLASFAANSDAAIRATEVAFRYGGGDALFDSSPLQRSLRDMRVGEQHILVSESNYEGLGKALTL